MASTKQYANDSDTQTARRLPGTKGRKSTKFPAFNLKAAAEVLGISPAHMSRVLHGERRTSLDLALKISKLFGMPVEEIGRPQVNSHKGKIANAKSKTTGNSSRTDCRTDHRN